MQAFLRTQITPNPAMKLAVQTLKSLATTHGVRKGDLPLFKGFLIAYVAVDCYRNNITNKDQMLKKLALLSTLIIKKTLLLSVSMKMIY